MDADHLLQQLRELSLEEGRQLLLEHAAGVSDHAAFGVLLADEALKELYTPFLSLKLAEHLIFFGEHFQHLSSHALGLKAKGDALYQIGHFQAAIACLDCAGDEFLRLGDEGNWARSRISWIVSSASLGSIQDALHQAAQARDAFLRLGEYYWACVIDHNTAMIYDNLGRYQDAYQLYERMLDIYPTVTDQRETSLMRSIALAQMNQAIHIAWFGDFERAYHLQQQARANLLALQETSLVIYSEIHLADLNYTQGSFGSALRGYYQAIDRLAESNIDDPSLLAELKYCIAHCLIKLHRPQEASLLANAAVEMYRKTGKSLNTGLALREYASTLLASGRSMEALDALDEASTLFQQHSFDHYMLLTRLQRAEFLLVMGFDIEAYHQARLIRTYFETQRLVAYAARANLVMQRTLIAIAQKLDSDEGNKRRNILLRKAATLCNTALSQARQHNLQEEIYQCHHMLGNIYELQALPAQATEHYHAAIAQIEHMLDDLAYDLSSAFLHTTWRVYEDMISVCLQQSQHEQAFGYLEQARSMALRQYLHRPIQFQGQSTLQESTDSPLQMHHATTMRIQQELKNWQEQYRYYTASLASIDTSVSTTVDGEIIQSELRRCEAKIGELFERLHFYQEEALPALLEKDFEKGRANTPVQPVSIDQLRQMLLPDQLLLAYFLHNSTLVIFGITAERSITYEIANGVTQLEHWLPFFHAHLQPGGWPDTKYPPQQAIRRLLKKLYDLLIAPAAALLPPSSGQLTIVPYGLLHKLPFHALYDGSHFLIENFEINYLPASNLLLHFQPASRQSHSCHVFPA